jgi:hypothetical protein
MPSVDQNHETTTTKLRTFRLSQGIISTLQAEAKRRELSVNALVSAIILRFLGWDRFADQFRFVSLTSDLLLAMLSGVSDEEIARTADTTGTRRAEEFMKLWPEGSSPLDGFVAYLNNRCRYAGYGNLSYEVKGERRVLTIEHGLGIKWSIFLQHVIENILRKLGIASRFQISENTVTVHFKT